MEFSSQRFANVVVVVPVGQVDDARAAFETRRNTPPR